MVRKKDGVCLTHGCGRKSAFRGLCLPCYMAAWRLVHKGLTTWKKLERQGKALPDAREKSRKKLRSAFGKAFAASKG